MLSSKVKALKPSPTLALTALAQKLKSQGHDVINLSAGQPDWNTFQNVADAGISAIQKGFTRYTPSGGIPHLRSVIAQNCQQHLNIAYTQENVTVSAGSKFILFSALQSLLDQGDEVIIPTPYWVSYPEMVRLAGGQVVIAETHVEDHFKLTINTLKKSLTDNTKILLLNSPSNPTGESYSKEELTAIASVIRDHKNILVFSDDIYNQLFFDDLDYAPHILEVAPDLREQVLILNGVSKTYAMTGWRIGWAVGPEVLIKAMTSFQSQSVSCAASFSQSAAIEALTNTSSQVRATVLELKDRRDFAYNLFKDILKLSLNLPSGGLYLWINISAFLNQKNRDSRDFCKNLLENQKVAIVPGIEFGKEGYVRIIYAVNKKEMLEAHKRISNFLMST